MIKIIKGKVKEMNTNLKIRIDELTNVIKNKDVELTEMQMLQKQLAEANKNANERIENLEKMAQASEKIKIGEIINSNDEVKDMKEIDQKYSKLNKRAINEIKHSIKYDTEIVVTSE